MRRIVLLLIACCVLPVSAQQDIKGLSAQELESTITTLETEADRKALVNDLKAILEAKRQQESKKEPGENLPLEGLVDNKGNEVIALYQDWLERWDISESLAGDVITLAAATGLVLVVLFLNRLMVRSVERRLKGVRQKFRLDQRRFRSLLTIERHLVAVLGLALVVYAASDVLRPLLPELVRNLELRSLFIPLISVLFVAVLFVAIWEFCNAFIEFGASKSKLSGSARLETLLPIVRNTLMFILVVMGLLIALSEVGIDITPLLAGAGVLGIAVGFGAQTLVKDFINGFFIILEDLLQIGDVVTLGARTGIVEKITIRKIQLRDLDGTVHTVPFGEVAIVDNLTKDFSYYLMDIGVAYRENVDEVIEHVKTIVEGMRKSEDFARFILEPVEILGVDRFADSAVIVRARIKTTPLDKWRVGREFNRRMKHHFDKHDVEIPFPHRTLYFGVDKQGEAPAGNVKVIEGGNRDASDDSTETRAGNARADDAKRTGSSAPDTNTEPDSQ